MNIITQEKINLNFLKTEVQADIITKDKVQGMISAHDAFIQQIEAVVARNGWVRKELYVQSDRAKDWSDIDEYLRTFAHAILDLKHEIILGTHIKITVIYEPKTK